MIEELKSKIQQGQSIKFKIKVVPGSSRTQIGQNLTPDILKIKIAAAPEKGKANRELIRYLAKTFGVPKKNIAIVSGLTSPLKIIEIRP